jgi:ATP synthase, Delta/Epsilon chain, beta-sandwich domain
MMRLTITEPVRVIADHDDVVSVRAEDASGSFGILPGHADLITVLTPSVVAWRHSDGRLGWCAVRGGVLSAPSTRGCDRHTPGTAWRRSFRAGTGGAGTLSRRTRRRETRPGRRDQTPHSRDPPDHPSAAS